MSELSDEEARIAALLESERAPHSMLARARQPMLVAKRPPRISWIGAAIAGLVVIVAGGTLEATTASNHSTPTPAPTLAIQTSTGHTATGQTAHAHPTARSGGGDSTQPTAGSTTHHGQTAGPTPSHSTGATPPAATPSPTGGSIEMSGCQFRTEVGNGRDYYPDATTGRAVDISGNLPTAHEQLAAAQGQKGCAGLTSGGISVWTPVLYANGAIMTPSHVNLYLFSPNGYVTTPTAGLIKQIGNPWATSSAKLNLQEFYFECFSGSTGQYKSAVPLNCANNQVSLRVAFPDCISSSNQVYSSNLVCPSGYTRIPSISIRVDYAMAATGSVGKPMNKSFTTNTGGGASSALSSMTAGWWNAWPTGSDSQYRSFIWGVDACIRHTIAGTGDCSFGNGS